jgi:uncharacterized protein (TIGR02118 family)
MIRLTYLLRAKPGMSPEDFQTYWREHHGPLVESHADRLAMLRYVQVHTLHDLTAERPGSARGPMEEPYDGVAEVWWSDRDSLAAALATAEGRKAADEILEDERNFIDHPSSPLWLAYEYPQINPTPEMVAAPDSDIHKSYYPLRHPRNLSLAEAQLYWRTQHGPLIRSVSAGRLLRYMQVHRFEDELEAELRGARGTETEAYTGHAETWQDRSNPIPPPRPPDPAAGRGVVIEDEAKFIDFQRSTTWIATEWEFFDRR